MPIWKMNVCSRLLRLSVVPSPFALRRVQLKAFFHDKEDDSDTCNKDIFETL